MNFEPLPGEDEITTLYLEQSDTAEDDYTIACEKCNWETHILNVDHKTITIDDIPDHCTYCGREAANKHEIRRNVTTDIDTLLRGTKPYLRLKHNITQGDAETALKNIILAAAERLFKLQDNN